MPGMIDALSEERDGMVISIEVTASGKKAAFPAGYNVWRKTIGCRVTAPALEGRANRAVIELVADTFCRPSASVSIISGATSSQKKVLVTGITKDEVIRILKKDIS